MGLVCAIGVATAASRCLVAWEHESATLAKESPQNRFLRFYCVGTLRVPRIFPAFHSFSLCSTHDNDGAPLHRMRKSGCAGFPKASERVARYRVLRCTRHNTTVSIARRIDPATTSAIAWRRASCPTMFAASCLPQYPAAAARGCGRSGATARRGCTRLWVGSDLGSPRDAVAGTFARYCAAPKASDGVSSATGKVRDIGH